ncbi:Type IV secretory pathway, VirD4 component, TraG/TraD family ATPase [Nocardioides terrae]|uniref:Type IV secretory pathway, VirD4 component, TraG/TraD family ATPase n=1 Tax=Nocardioides terrae TaxID=574651 RepID=A0A1I1NH33_9ACTN|nr:type IV secretory system conjugative DNA transfer family protein [Nocardioides terrae]SFC97014.1 Type IV secretory pathway, VirD4 component, TraG/TraD family ATPase [Nocardioides terrae]
MIGQSSRADADSDLSAGVILLVGSSVVVGAAVLWIAGRLSLVIGGAGWSDAPFSQSPHFLIGILSGHAADTAWANAYPSSHSLNAPVFWSIAFAMSAFTVAVGVAACTTCRSGVTRGTPARWATRRRERSLAVPRDPEQRPWRLVAGRSRRTHRLLAGDDCVSAVAFGPNGSGKTTSLIVPNVLDWQGPVVLTTAKPQDLEPVITARRRNGPVWVIAPGGAPGHETSGWCPVTASHDDEAADRVAEWLVDASGMTDDPRARPWNAQARKYLKGLLLATHLDGAEAPIERWCQWIYAGERARDQVEDILRSNGHDETAQEYAATFTIHEEGKGSVLFTAMGLADTYSRPGIRTVTNEASGPDGFTADRLLDDGGTLCVVTPSGQGDRFAPYFTALLTAVIHAAETRAAGAGGPLTPRLLLALDEAGNVFRYPRLPHLLTTSRGNGIQLLLIYHDLAQVEHLYGGREVARTVVSNAKLRLLLPGVGDLETLRYWTDLLGRTRTLSHSETRGADGHRSRSRNDHTDDLAPLHVLQQLPDGEAVLVYQNLPPTRVRLQPWYRTRRFRHLRSVASPAGGMP